jgi:hypothetical protein
VLGSLPSTRPQRPSARRAAARRAAAASSTATADAPNAPAVETKSTTTATPAAHTRPRPAAKARATQGTKTSVRPAADARSRRAGRTRPALTEPPVPPQGFETEEQIEPGRSVQPPGGPELAASVVELFGELAQAGLSAGGHLLGDALKRLTGG